MPLHIPPALDESPEGGRIGELPPSAQFVSFDELHKFLQQWGRQNGVAFIKKSSSNFRKIDGQAIATYIRLHCDRGEKRASASSGIRACKSRLIDCSFRVRASCKKQLNNMWVYDVVGGHTQHNHGRSSHPLAHTIHRRRTSPQRKTIRELIALPGIETSEIIERLQLQHPEALVTARDIENERQLARREALALIRDGPPAEAPEAPAEDELDEDFESPEVIFAEYKDAREKWYADPDRPPGVPRTNAAYRKASGLPARYRKCDYAWCLDWNQMKKQCVSESVTRPWTKGEMMAWLDYSDKERDSVEASVQEKMAANGYVSTHRGIGALLAEAAADIAARKKRRREERRLKGGA